MARFAASRADGFERSVDVALDPVLNVELEAEKSGDREDDGRQQAD